MKLKSIIGALALSIFATSASAGGVTPLSTAAFTTLADSGNSSLVFSAWNSTGSYTFDLGTLLNTIVGADTVASTGGANATPNTNNTLTAATTSGSGSYDIKLTGFAATAFAASGSSWNLVAADSLSRNRALITQATTTAGQSITNDTVGLMATGLDNYLSLVGSGTLTNPAAATSNDLWWANGASWGDTLGGATSGTALAYGSIGQLFLAYQKSNNPDNGALDAGFSNLNYVAFTHLVGSDVYLTIQAVPEADTSGMMIAGLGMMGFIARRRKQVK